MAVESAFLNVSMFEFHRRKTLDEHADEQGAEFTVFLMGSERDRSTSRLAKEGGAPELDMKIKHLCFASRYDDKSSDERHITKPLIVMMYFW